MSLNTSVIEAGCCTIQVGGCCRPGTNHSSPSMSSISMQMLQIRSLERQLHEERSRLEYDSLEPPDYERIAMLEEQLQGMKKMNINKK